MEPTEPKMAAKASAKPPEPTPEPAYEAVSILTSAPPAEPGGAPATSDCVVTGAGPHVGRAVNGLVCSRHAVTHRPDGTPRR